MLVLIRLHAGYHGFGGKRKTISSRGLNLVNFDANAPLNEEGQGLIVRSLRDQSGANFLIRDAP